MAEAGAETNRSRTRHRRCAVGLRSLPPPAAPTALADDARTLGVLPARPRARPVWQVIAGPDGGAGAVGHADAAEHVADVGFHGGLADAQVSRDLLVGQPLCHQPEHLLLAGAEFVGGTGGLAGGQQRPGDPRVKWRVPLRGGTDGGHQVTWLAVL